MTYDEILATTEIQNIVTTTQIDQGLELQALADDLPSSKFDIDRFPAVVYRSETHEATVLIFRSGKLVGTGARSFDTVDGTYQALSAEFENLGLSTPEETYEIANIVASANLDVSLNLNAVAIGLSLEQTEYEPEVFPGLVYRPDATDVVTLLFGNGRVVVTGATSKDQLLSGFQTILRELDDMDFLSSQRISA